MKEQPTLETDRLLLRPLLLQDDFFVRELANNPKLDSMNIWPLHGYGRQMARRWIGLKRVAWGDGTAAEFGIALKSGGELLGLVGLDAIDAVHASAELSFLLPERFWGQGYATEAAARLVRYGFEGLKLNRIYARHLASNNASARVLAKLGMVQEGLLRELARKGDAFHDVVMMALLRKEWPPAQKLDQPAASIATQQTLS